MSTQLPYPITTPPEVDLVKDFPENDKPASSCNRNYQRKDAPKQGPVISRSSTHHLMATAQSPTQATKP